MQVEFIGLVTKVTFPIENIIWKKDFRKMVYAIFGMFFQHYKTRMNTLSFVYETCDSTFYMEFHWHLTVEELAELDELVRFYYGF